MPGFCKAATLEEIRKHYLPNTTIVFKDMQNEQEVNQIADHIKEIKMAGDKPTVYICEDYSCQEPITSVSQLREHLKAIT